MARKPLIVFLLISFGLGWTLFCIPLAFRDTPETYRAVVQVCFMAAMWTPGLGAIIAVRYAEKQPVIKTLRLNKLGPKRFYLAAWFLPPVILIATIATSVLIGTGVVDPDLTFLRDSMAQMPKDANLPPVEIWMMAQVALAVIFAPFINLFFTLGEELGWRGFLLSRLRPLGQWKAILLSGLIWGIWHAPTTLLHGYNFPLHPYLGLLIGSVGFTLLGVMLAWLALKTQSPWAPALGHGAFNGVAGLIFFFLVPGFDTALAGSPIGLAGWIPLVLVIVGLIWAKQLPGAPSEKPAA